MEIVWYSQQYQFEIIAPWDLNVKTHLDDDEYVIGDVMWCDENTIISPPPWHIWPKAPRLINTCKRFSNSQTCSKVTQEQRYFSSRCQRIQEPTRLLLEEHPWLYDWKPK